MGKSFYYLVYGFLIPNEIFNSFKDELKDHYSYYSDNEFTDMSYFVTNSECICGLRTKVSEDYFKFNQDEMNEFTQEDKTFELFNKYVPKLLKHWSKFIEDRTDDMKQFGFTEEEVAKELEALEPKEQMNFDFYVVYA